MTSEFKNRLHSALPLIGVLFLTGLVYLAALGNGFINLDDNIYSTSIRVLSFKNIVQAFSQSFEGHYHPLTLLSFGINYHFFGLDPFSAHLTNMLFHILNTALVFFFIKGLTKDRVIALVASLVFGIHPVHVEPVAWIASRKDVLYTCFYLFALISYIKYADAKGNRYYWYAFILFLLSVLSKGMAVALAPTLVAVDYCLNRKILSKKVLYEKVPFFLLSLFFGFLTIGAQKNTGYLIESSVAESLLSRFLYACYGFLLYIYNLILPNNLGPYYPYPQKIMGHVQVEYYAYFLLIVVFVTALVYALRRSRLVSFGVMFFVINVALMLKLVPVSDFIAADRYAYVASIGFCILVGVGYRALFLKSVRTKKVAQIILLAYVVGLSAVTYAQCLIWDNGVVLWSNALGQNQDNVFVLNMRGGARCEFGDYEEGLKDFSRAIEVNPDVSRSYLNRGFAKYKTDNFSGAIDDYTMALELDPLSYLAYNNRGLVKFQLKDFSGAVDDYNKAIELNPGYLDAYLAYYNRYQARLILGDNNGAVEDIKKVEELNPEYIENQGN